MHDKSHRTGRAVWALSVAVMLLLGACGPASGDATPTVDVQAIYTFAFQTLSAQQATQLALIPPTGTPVPTTAATLPPPSPLATIPFFGSATPRPGGGGGTTCDSAAYVSDVTIPDGTTIAPGKKFDKTWSLLNNGTCTWSTSYKIAFDSGEAMGGSSGAISSAVAPGTVANVTVSLTAPTSDGTYTGTWRMQNASGQAFGSFNTVVIKVGTGGSSVTATAGPSPTPGGNLVSISGSLGAVEVSLAFSGTSYIPNVTYTGQDYTFDVPVGWSGTITPSKGAAGKWEFDPSSKSFVNVKSNKTQDFTAIPIDMTPTP